MSALGWICIKLNEYFKEINKIRDCDAPDRVRAAL